MGPAISVPTRRPPARRHLLLQTHRLLLRPAACQPLQCRKVRSTLLGRPPLTTSLSPTIWSNAARDRAARTSRRSERRRLRVIATWVLPPVWPTDTVSGRRILLVTSVPTPASSPSPLVTRRHPRLLEGSQPRRFRRAVSTSRGLPPRTMSVSQDIEWNGVRGQGVATSRRLRPQRHSSRTTTPDSPPAQRTAIASGRLMRRATWGHIRRLRLLRRSTQRHRRRRQVFQELLFRVVKSI